jgi:hypothetical protein
MSSTLSGAQGYMGFFEAVQDNGPILVPWPQLGQTFLYRMDGVESRPSLGAGEYYRRRGRIKNVAVDFRVGGYVVASRWLKFPQGSIGLTDSEMLQYWTVAVYNSKEVNENIGYARIEIWLPVGSSINIFGDYWKWVPG